MRLHNTGQLVLHPHNIRRTYLFYVYSPVQCRLDQADRGFLFLSFVDHKGIEKLTSACRFRLIGTRRNIPADIPWGESVAEE